MNSCMVQRHLTRGCEGKWRVFGREIRTKCIWEIYWLLHYSYIIYNVSVTYNIHIYIISLRSIFVILMLTSGNQKGKVEYSKENTVPWRWFTFLKMAVVRSLCIERLQKRGILCTAAAGENGELLRYSSNSSKSYEDLEHLWNHVSRSFRSYPQTSTFRPPTQRNQPTDHSPPSLPHPSTPFPARNVVVSWLNHWVLELRPCYASFV